MQFKLFTTLALTATAFALPAVEVLQARSDGGIAATCQQAQGQLVCCQQKPVAAPTIGTGISPSTGGLLGLIPNIIPYVVPTLAATVQCVAVVAQVQACATPNVCCNGSYNGQNSAGLINLLSNNQLFVCPSIAA